MGEVKEAGLRSTRYSKHLDPDFRNACKVPTFVKCRRISPHQNFLSYTSQKQAARDRLKHSAIVDPDTLRPTSNHTGDSLANRGLQQNVIEPIGAKYCPFLRVIGHIMPCYRTP